MPSANSSETGVTPGTLADRDSGRISRRCLVLRLLLVLLLVPIVHGFAGSGARADNRTVPALPTDWRATGLIDHPLVGKVWSSAQGAIVPAQDMGRAIALGRFVLLGEVHDNPDHHLWQAWGIRTISKLRGARIVEGAPQIEIIAMEMLSVDQNAGIDRFYGRDVEVPRPRGAKAFGRMVGWETSGWPDYAIYAPIIDQALFEQIVVVPASASRELTRNVSKEGLAALSIEEADRLALSKPLPEADAQALRDEIRDSHCGLMPETAFDRMSVVQRFRDATMADALLSVATGKGGILIAGNGHVRRDRGVAHYLAARGVAPKDIVAVGIVEVAEGKVDPQAYAAGPGGQSIYDFVVFTPRLERPDPCVAMRESFGKKSAAPAAAPSSPAATPPAR
ncbi:MAG: ChaN family lipoprotein [Hyphomicrobiaceae bacterium]|nr:ChaN family lipoprotein [Hyphomicrobiaceae bacterium]